MADTTVTDSGATPTRPPGMVTVIGLTGEAFGTIGDEAQLALMSAELVVGEPRQLKSLKTWMRTQPGASDQDTPCIEVGLRGGIDADNIAHTADAVAVADDDIAYRQAAAAARDGVPVCILATGDPGFFGVIRSLILIVDRHYLRILPAPSSVSLAFARLALPWEDAVVVTIQGRQLAEAMRVILLARKAAVLTSPDAPPEAVGRALVAARASVDMVAVCSRLGYSDESVTVVSLPELANQTWNPCSVVVLVGPGGQPIAGWGDPAASVNLLAWGLPANAFAHGDGKVTEAEVRAVALGKLALPATGVMWDMGEGSGSVAAEAAVLCPGMTIFAIQERGSDATQTTEQAISFRAGVRVVHGLAPQVCEGLPDPDRVFVGDGGLDLLDAALARLRPGGRIVATFAALDQATGAADRLGNLIQISTSRGLNLADGSWQLTAADPLFLAWGPQSHADGVTSA